MSRSVNKVSNHEKLIQEKHELQTFCTSQEKLISLKFDELKKNFPEIITNEILPYSQERNNKILSILDIANEIIFRFLPPRFRNSMLTRIALKIIQVFVIRGFRKRSEK
ncbi:MAG: hypothetical protein Q7U54_19920 [Bacteroidales bacterium]|nr:hypothetical protein [Bacteroidales bacterium]